MTLEEKLTAPVVRLNVCSGRHVLPDFINVDVVVSDHPKAKGRVPDVLADARSIPLPDACAHEILVVHGFEHFFPWECDDLLNEWGRLLKPGGSLVLELPDMIKFCRNIISGYTVNGKDPDQYGMWGAWGDPRTRDPLMMHKWGWSPKTLGALLQSHGFVDIAEEMPQWHASGRSMRDMRITSRKPENA